MAFTTNIVDRYGFIEESRSYHFRGVVNCNSEFKNKVIEDVFLVEFEEVYSNVLLSMRDSGYRIRADFDMLDPGSGSILGVMCEYLNRYFSELSVENKNWIYIDTDRIYFEGEYNLLGINLPHKVDHIDFIRVDGPKKICQYSDSKFQVHRNGNDFVPLVKSMLRERTIDTVLY